MTFEDSVEMPVVHVWSQGAWHDSAYIVGDRDGLIKLRGAIDQAIKSGAASAEVFVIDGEGYNIEVKCVEDTKRLAVPYLESYAKEERTRKDVTFPWRTIK
jgi:hypothetical protein